MRGPVASPGALKPKDGDGEESSQPLVYSLCLFYPSTSPSLFHFYVCTFTGVYDNNNNSTYYLLLYIEL